MGHSHNLVEGEFHTNLARISDEFRINLARIWHRSHDHVTCVSHLSHIFSPVQQSFVSEMSQHLSQLGSLPDPATDTDSHFQSRPILAHELEEATYESNDLHVGSIVEWAGKQQPPPPSR